MRARNIKPSFWTNEVLAQLPLHTRLLFIGLWMVADREGLLEERPDRLKAEIFPYDQVDVRAALDSLCQMGFLARYEAGGLKMIHVVKFLKHQSPHHTERRSNLPKPAGGQLQIGQEEAKNEALAAIKQRLWATVQFQIPEWRAWCDLAVTNVMLCPGAVSPLAELIEYIGKCADPAQREKKDLGVIKAPANFFVKRLRAIAAERGIPLPTCPTPRKATG